MTSKYAFQFFISFWGFKHRITNMAYVIHLNIAPSSYLFAFTTFSWNVPLFLSLYVPKRFVCNALTCFCILRTTSYWSNITRVQSTQNVKYHFANFPSAWLIHKTLHLFIRLHMMINSLNFVCCLFQFKTRFCNIKKFLYFEEICNQTPQEFFYQNTL